MNGRGLAGSAALLVIAVAIAFGAWSFALDDMPRTALLSAAAALAATSVVSGLAAWREADADLATPDEALARRGASWREASQDLLATPPGPAPAGRRVSWQALRIAVPLIGLIFVFTPVGGMLGPGVLLVVPVLVGIVAAVLVHGALARRRRLHAAVAARGWGLATSCTNDRVARFRGLFPFTQGGRATCHVAGRARGLPFEAFDWHWTTGSSKNRQHHQRTVVVLPTPMRAPGLSIRRETVLHRVGDLVGQRDIDFESDAFSRRFHVTCDDRRFAYDVLGPALIEDLVAIDAPYLIQWEGDVLCLVDAHAIGADGIDGMLEVAHRIVARLPRHLKADERYERRPTPEEPSWAPRSEAPSPPMSVGFAIGVTVFLSCFIVPFLFGGLAGFGIGVKALVAGDAKAWIPMVVGLLFVAVSAGVTFLLVRVWKATRATGTTDARATGAPDARGPQP